MVTSEEAESSKPEENIFNFAQNKSYLVELKPSEVLHIGDDYSKVMKALGITHRINGMYFKDYLGAKAAGLQAIMVDRYYQPVKIFLNMIIKTGGVNFVRTALQMTWSQM